MAASSLKCPECSVVLKLSAPVAAGKKIRCPKCQTSFLPDSGIQPDTPVKATPRKPATRKSAPELVEPIDGDEDESDRPRRKSSQADPDRRPRRKAEAGAPGMMRLFILLGALGVVG